MNGYAGTILRVDLSNKTIAKQPYPEKVAQDFLGGRGLGIYTLWTEVPHGANPLGSENKLIASTGPLSGLLVPGAGKMDWTCKSPLTGGYASASMGGMLSAELKYAGYDSVIFEGASDIPAYLFIDDDKVELRDASEMWGKGCITTEKVLKDRLGEEFQIATIGPGGENGVKYACIHHDWGRQAGRGGVGTVMGAKKLKAVAVRGTKGIPVADVKAFHQQSRKMFKACKDSELLEAFLRYGTTIITSWCDEVGALPTRNFETGVFEEGPNLYGEVMRQKIVVTDKGCSACPCPCGKYSHSKKHNVWVEGPEYETIGMLGSNCGLSDIEDVARANFLCDELGIDTISAGGCIAFATECFLKGILTTEDTDGLELDWGKPEAVYALIEKIARRQGIGAVLAEGVKQAASVWGQGSEEFAIHVKGMEMSAYDVHLATGMLVAYQTCDVGAHHNRAWAITYDLEVGREAVTPEKVARVIYLQHARPFFDLAGGCRFQWIELAIDVTEYAPMLKTITGIDRSWDDLLKLSERVWNLTRMYWVREVPGFGRQWDYPPPRFYKHPATTGPTQGQFTRWEDVQKLLDIYYKQRGWDANGIPTREKLVELDLADLVTL